MKFLVARPGKLVQPEFNNVNELRPTILNPGSIYDSGWGSNGKSNFPGEADYFYQPIPNSYLSAMGGEIPAPTYIWGIQGWTTMCSPKLAPKMKIGDEIFDPDSNPVNGHISWGGGKVRYAVADIGSEGGALVTPHLGYIYHKNKGNSSNWHDRVFAYYDNGRWKGDGWYEMNVEPVKADTTWSWIAYPKGTLLNSAETSSNVSCSIEWEDLYHGTMDNLEQVTYSEDVSAAHVGYGLPVWKGQISAINPSMPDVYLVGVPRVNELSGTIDLEFLWDNYYNPQYYYNRYEKTYRYEGEDTRSIFPRDFTAPNWDQGWWEFQPPQELRKGATLYLANLLPVGSQATPQPAVLSLDTFIQPSRMEINCWANPFRTYKESFESGMLLGTFNIGTTIY